LINLSSVSIYGKPNFSNIDESFIPKPISIYGLSKLLIEYLFSATIPKYTQLVNLRLGYVLGPEMPSRYVLSRFQNMILNNEQISLINPDSTQFSFIDISDIARTCKVIFDKNISGTYNVVGDETPTLREVFNSIRKFYPTHNPSVTESVNPKMKFSTSFSNRKIKQFGITFKNYRQSFEEIFTSD